MVGVAGNKSREKKINRFVVQRMEGWADDGERKSDTDAYNTLTRSRVSSLYGEGDRSKAYGVCYQRAMVG